MADDRDLNEGAGTKPAPKLRPGMKPRFPLWQKLLLGLSVALMVIGGGLMIRTALAGGDNAIVEPRVETGGEPPAGLVRSLDSPGAVPADEGDDGAGAPAPGGIDAWSPTIFRLGFSFFAGFCLGYVFRTFLKISIFGIGLLLLLGFGFQYLGVIDVDWAKVGTVYEKSLAWLKEETQSFTAFVKGYLPSAASAGTGLVVGFRKR